MTEGYKAKVRPEKVKAIEEIRDQIGGAAATLLTEYRGLTVPELGDLRSQLRAAGASYKVVKNTLARRATVELGIEGAEELLVGPVAIAYCHDDPVAGAKALAGFAKDHPGLVIKGAILDGRLMSPDEANALATVDAQEVSLAKIAGSLTSPLAGIAATLEAPLQQVLYALQQIASKPEAA